MAKHILIVGRRHVGKSTLVKRLLQHVFVPVYGFCTKSTPRREDGFHSIYMHPAGLPEREWNRTDENHIGDCNSRERTVHTEVFDTLGTRYLEAKPGGILVMDELGFMEEPAEAFCGKVLEALDGDIPVLATVKDSSLGASFLDRVRNHPNAAAYYITEENRDNLYDELLPSVQQWNMTAGCSGASGPEKAPKVFCIAGAKNSGKTTLATALVARMAEQGRRVAVIKHDGHDFACDVPGTDSHAYTGAGAYGVAVFSGKRMFVHRVGTGETEAELIRQFPEADLILIEGLKDSRYPKIEVVRAEISDRLVSNPEGRFLIVSDLEADCIAGRMGEPVLGFAEIDEILHHVEACLWEEDGIE